MIPEAKSRLSKFVRLAAIGALALTTFGLASFSASVTAIAGYGQSGETKMPFSFSKKPTTCEINLLRLEQLSRAAAKEIDKGGVLIAIARNGSYETSQDLLRRRLYNVRAFFTEYQPLKDVEIVTAKGAPEPGYGRVELYLGGKLVEVLLVHRNKDLCVHCCDIDPRFTRTERLRTSRNDINRRQCSVVKLQSQVVLIVFLGPD